MENPFNRRKEQIIGKVSEQEKESSEAFLRVLKHRGSEPVSLEELEKTEDENKLIILSNDAIISIIKDLKLSIPELFNSKNIHVLPETYDGLDMEHHLGQYDSVEDSIFIKRKDDGVDFYRTLVHELLHAYSVNKFRVKILDRHGNTSLGAYRSGYHLSKKDGGESLDKFLYFNEAVVEKLSREIVLKTVPDLRKLKFLNEYSSDGAVAVTKATESSFYDYQVKLLDYAIKRLSEETGKNPEDIKNNLYKGLFSGEMMHLREFEKVFGPKTLQILSMYGANTLQEPHDEFYEEKQEETYRNFCRYFDAKPQDRQIIGEDLMERLLL